MATLFAIGYAPEEMSGAERPETAAARRWLAEGTGALWVHGRSGSGRSRVVASALCDCPALGLHAWRVRCSKGHTLEELLDETAAFFFQAGDSRLRAVLEQRIGLGGKVAALFDALGRTRTVLWIDDFDLLEDAAAESGRDATPLAYFARGLEGLDGSSGRAVVISTRPPPSPSLRSLEVGELGDEAAASIWALSGGPPLRGVSAVLARAEKSPLAVRLLARAASRLAREDFLRLEGAGADLVRSCLEAAAGRLSAPARAALEAAAVLSPAVRLPALREVVSGAFPELAHDPSSPETETSELEGWGLFERTGGESARSVAVPRRVREFVEARLAEEAPERAQALRRAAGLHFARLAARSEDPWHSFAAWRHFSLAGAHEEAYEIQKVFAGEFLRRGFLDMAAWVLRRTAETTSGPARSVALGNLAITYKNAGEYARALETYESVRGEFEASGDLPNLARVLHQIGNVHYLRGDFAAATAAYEASLEISRDLGDRAVRVATRIQLANVRYRARDLEGALAGYLEALEDARALGANGLSAIVALEIAQIHAVERRYVEAESVLAEAEAWASAAGDLRTLVKVQQAQGLLASRRREYGAAKSSYGKARRNAEILGDVTEVAGTLVLLGDLERASLQPKEALSSYLEARDLLGTYAAQGAAPEAEREALGARASARIRELAESLGEETFQRILRGAGRDGNSGQTQD